MCNFFVTLNAVGHKHNTYGNLLINWRKKCNVQNSGVPTDKYNTCFLTSIVVTIENLLYYVEDYWKTTIKEMLC